MGTLHDINTESQCEKILADLKNGKSITPLEALNKYGCLRLSARIYDLKQQGHAISKVFVKNECNGKSYASYSLQG